MTPDRRPIGFIGLGVMGLPMAMNLLRSGARLVVWNRSAEKCAPLRALGATLAPTVSAVFDATDTIILMLATATAMDAVLARGTPAFAAQVRGHTVINTSTTSPSYSSALAADIAAAGGCYIECPVSGSAKQARAAQLIGMLAGEPDTIAAVRPWLSPMLRESFVCGPVPSALRMKLAVNLYLITLVTGLCEAFQFAEIQGLDLHQFQAILDAGPMASSVSSHKLRKLVNRDTSAEASIDDVLKNNRLIADEARRAGIASPLLDACHAVYAKAENLGLGAQDMVMVVRSTAELCAKLQRDRSPRPRRN